MHFRDLNWLCSGSSSYKSEYYKSITFLSILGVSCLSLNGSVEKSLIPICLFSLSLRLLSLFLKEEKKAMADELCLRVFSLCLGTM
jgi:hypothetical protein